ncbi:MAG: glycosyltransferase [Candidatus Omnitrophica bacterium]|nr:glycosyltransferase [Candidatus Omnitrophota bacterium]
MMNSICYVNYAPYGNAGHILDYLLNAFDTVVYVSFVFHPVEKHNYVQIYRRGVLSGSFCLPTLLVPRKHVHYFASLLSLLTAVELFCLSIYVRLKYKIKPQIFLAPNAFLILVGIMLRCCYLVDKVIFWVWDFYPIPRKGFYKKIFFKLYWRLDKLCTRGADFLWFINERLLQVRREISFESDLSGRCSIVPLGMKLFSPAGDSEPRGRVLGFVGMLKRSQGVELLVNALPALVKEVPDIRVEIIGTGPDQDYFKNLAGKTMQDQRINFKGFIESESQMRRIVSSWDAAVALYVPEEGNLSAFADPSKVKLYLECTVPVIMTNVPVIAEEIGRKKAGIVIDYDETALVCAVKKVFTENSFYRKNCKNMVSGYDYCAVYDGAFTRVSVPAD